MDASRVAIDALAAARQRRIEAYVPAYQGYVTFKRLVRDVCGPSSPEYRRLHPRGEGTKQLDPDQIEAEEQAPDSGVMPASKAAPAAPSDSSPAKVA
jgi:hypothetical protein